MQVVPRPIISLDFTRAAAPYPAFTLAATPVHIEPFVLTTVTREGMAAGILKNSPFFVAPKADRIHVDAVPVYSWCPRLLCAAGVRPMVRWMGAANLVLPGSRASRRARAHPF